MPNLDILTIGDSSIDLFMQVANDSGVSEVDNNTELPKVCFYHGSKIAVDSFKTSIAGNAINVAVGTKLLGLTTGVYTKIGDDANADRIIAELIDIGTDTRFCIKEPGTETDLHTVISFAGDRTIFSYHGKRTYTLQKWDQPKFIYYTSMGGNFETFQKDLIKYLEENPQTALAFNPGTMQIKSGVEKLKDILAHTAILFVNKEEAEKLTDSKSGTDLLELHKKLVSLGPKLTAITLGDGGATVYDGTNMIFHDKYSDSRPMVDKTGAGDSFSSGFLSAIIYGKSLKEALIWGVVNAGSGIKVIGATHGLLTKTQMEKIVQSLKE